MKWPGIAAVDVSLISINKGYYKFEKVYLNSKVVSHINSLLSDAIGLQTAAVLKRNESKSFIGSNILGGGFILEENLVTSILQSNPQYKTVLYPYLSGDDINNESAQNAKRYVINFQNFPFRRYSEEEWEQLSIAKKEEIYKDISNGTFIHFAPPNYELPVALDFPICLEIVKDKVKPERDLLSDKIAKEKWWLYERQRKELYNSIFNNKYAYAISRVTKHCIVSPVPLDIVYSNATVVFSINKIQSIFLNSGLHDSWCWNYGSTMGTGTLRYTPSDCFETFPFPQNLNSKLETIGEAYHEHRRQLMLGIQLGLTKTYNLFHSNAIIAQSINDKDKQVASLQKHLEKTTNTISFHEAIQGILKLRELHVQMDEAVLYSYGWNDVALKHDFYEVDYLPENDRVRFTIHPDARKEVLKRLLDLNHKIHEEEKASGLLDKKKTVNKNKPFSPGTQELGF